MVTQSTLDTLIRGMELYFLRQNNFRLDGKSYDLLMLVESGTFGYPTYNLLLSAQMLDERNHLAVVKDILNSFRRLPDFSVFSLINSLQVLRSDSGFVQKARRMLLARPSASQPIYEAHSVEIDGELFNSVLFVRSHLLERLTAGATVKLELDDDGYLRVLPVRVVDITPEFGLRVEQVPSENWRQPLPTYIQQEMAGGRFVYAIPLEHVQRVWREPDFS